MSPSRCRTQRRRALRCAPQLANTAEKVTREAGPVKGGTTVIAFAEDPDGYKIELIERKR